MKTRSCPPRRRSRRGFALVISLSLMVLLTVLATGLLSLSTISLRGSGREADMAVARANARLGMMIAVGRLQKLTGSDQRVTAPADLKLPAATMPRWVGVYGNRAKASYDDKPSSLPAKPCDPALLGWLVSGNESSAFQMSTGGDFGAVTTAGNPAVNPDDAVANLDDAKSTSSDITIGGRKAALIVGGGSVDLPKGYVAAPVVGVMESTGQQPAGGYAFWVGDEGMKARVNLRDHYLQVSGKPEKDQAKAYSFMTSQRYGIEMMRPGDAKNSKIGEAYDAASTELGKLVTTGNFPLLNSKDLREIARTRFHDITAYSQGVLADSYAGGLKRDVSSAIAGGPGTPADDEPVFTPESQGDFGLPTWGKIRSWAQRRAPQAVPPPNLSRVTPHTASQAGFGPVVTMASLGLGVEKASNNTLRVQLFPTVILWNPHAVGIPAANYELGIGVRNGGAIDIEIANSTNGPWTTAGTFQLSGGDATFAAGSGFFRFRVQGSVIPPGESHIYLLGASKAAYAPGTSSLVRAAAAEPIGYNTRYLTGPTITFDPAAFRTPYLRLNSKNTGLARGLSAGDQMEVVLTAPAELQKGFSESTPVYQAIGDLSTRRHHFPMAPLPIPAAGLEPMTALRVQTMMEGRGNSNADWSELGAMFQAGRPRGQERNRWLATTNPLAPYSKRTKTEAGLEGGNPVHGAVLAGDHAGGKLVLNMNISPGSGTAYRSQIGAGHDTGATPVDGILLDVLPTTSTLLSLGQLQHAPLSSFGFNTTYAFGNSQPDVRIPRAATFLPSQVSRPGSNAFTSPLYDVPWLANRALWDRYFVSSALPELSQQDIDDAKPLPNARMAYHSPAGRTPEVDAIRPGSARAFEEAAAHLMVAGGFNINSTSVDAWRAMLTGTWDLTVPNTLAHPNYSSTPLNAMMPRFSRDVRRSNTGTSDGILNMWGTADNRFNIYRGNRELVLLAANGSETPAKAASRMPAIVGDLAEKIVEEIRRRGPFLSVADFVNRKLEGDDTGLRGALQAAIDRTTGNSSVNPAAPVQSGIGAFVDGSDSNRTITAYDPEHYMGTPKSEQGSVVNSRTFMAPKHLTQADVLSTIGPAISARSDTFVVRSYGESLDDAGKVVARAWCEAVVQRVPEYVDPADAPTVAPAQAKPVNQKMGRRFEVVAFRWLSPEEI